LLRVLLVERHLIDSDASVQQDLAAHGCEVTCIHDALRASSTAEKEWPDLVVLNTCGGLPKIYELCEALDHTHLDLPRLIVSDGKGEEEVPGSAHISVPFTMRQLAYRIRKAIGSQTGRFLRLGDIVVDSAKRAVKRRDEVLHLTPKEARLLRMLMEHNGKVLPRSEIMKEVWETDYVGDTRTLEVHVRWIRKKLEKDPDHPEHIITVRGTGYFFRLLEDGDVQIR
jgi:DNA-binding response OmpR family regulator